MLSARTERPPPRGTLNGITTTSSGTRFRGRRAATQKTQRPRLATTEEIAITSAGTKRIGRAAGVSRWGRDKKTFSSLIPTRRKSMRTALKAVLLHQVDEAAVH